MLESFSYRATSAEELKVLRSCPEVLAIADGAPENASIATSTAVNAIFFYEGSFVVSFGFESIFYPVMRLCVTLILSILY